MPNFLNLNAKTIGFVTLSVFAFLFVGAFLLTRVNAAVVEYDTTFDTDGYLNWDAGSNYDEEANEIIIDSSGRYVITGYISNGPNWDMAVWRMKTDGSLDTTFGTGGYVILDNLAG